MRVVGCGMIDEVASRYPSRMGMIPKGFDELSEPRKVNAVGRCFRVEGLEDRPIAHKDSAEERSGAKTLLLVEDGTEDC